MSSFSPHCCCGSLPSLSPSVPQHLRKCPFKENHGLRNQFRAITARFSALRREILRPRPSFGWSIPEGGGDLTWQPQERASGSLTEGGEGGILRGVGAQRVHFARGANSGQNGGGGRAAVTRCRGDAISMLVAYPYPSNSRLPLNFNMDSSSSPSDVSTLFPISELNNSASSRCRRCTTDLIRMIHSSYG